MRKLAVITAFGGINPAGRSSGHQAFRRLVLNELPYRQQLDTLNALAQLMGLPQQQDITPEWRGQIMNGSLIRGWDNIDWDATAVPFHQPFTDEHGTPCWRLSHKRLAVQSAGQTPKGFDPAAPYPSHHHPRGLQLAVYGVSDALGQLGLDWEVIRQHLRPDQIAVYAGSAMGQLDASGHGGMLQSFLHGKRTSARQCALGLSEMPADFINAYVLGNVGATGSMTGACATFLYNLKVALNELHSGRRRLVIVGNSEAPLIPEIVEGFHAMTALATEHSLRELDGLSAAATPNFRRASRPFGDNAGFTLAESAQFFVLTDDALALELGLSIYAAVGDVFVHADGYKKSISNPGIGNYLCMGKAMAEARRWLGEQALHHGSFVQAHGSSTPANRTTESQLLSQLAGAFRIPAWDITAIKAHLGHSIAAASADQLTATLGSWAHGIIPGITTTHAVADDVQQQHLNILLHHKEIAADKTPLAFINSKGFGGNNASAFFISPHKTLELLQRQYSARQWQDYYEKNAAIQERSQQWDKDTSAGLTQPIYRFGNNVLEPEDLDINDLRIHIKGWENAVEL